MGDDPIANWKSKIECYLKNNHFQDMNRIDGMPTEFEWKIFPGITTLGILEEIQNFMTELQCKPDQFKDRIIFMSMNKDIAWEVRGNAERCEHNSQTVAEHARRFPRGDWSFSRPRSEKKWYGTYTDKPDGSWDKKLQRIWRRTSQIPVIQYFVGGGKKSTHSNGSDENVELLHRTVIFSNQLSVYGVIADLGRDLSEDLGLRET